MEVKGLKGDEAKVKGGQSFILLFFPCFFPFPLCVFPVCLINFVLSRNIFYCFYCFIHPSFSVLFLLPCVSLLTSFHSQFVLFAFFPPPPPFILQQKVLSSLFHHFIFPHLFLQPSLTLFSFLSFLLLSTYTDTQHRICKDVPLTLIHPLTLNLQKAYP